MKSNILCWQLSLRNSHNKKLWNGKSIMHSQSWLKVETNHMDRVILKSLKWNAKLNERPNTPHEPLRSQRWDERSSLKVLTKTHKMLIYSNIQLYGYVVVTYYTSLLWANIYYSHNIIYICIYIFLPPLTKKVSRHFLQQSFARSLTTM